MTDTALDRISLLIVEDDIAIADALSECLIAEGFVIVAARNGNEALARLRAGPRPAAILLDLLMPDMDGWEFRRQQLADPTLRDIATIVLTAMPGKYTVELDRSPRLAVVHKPIDPKELTAAIRRLISEADQRAGPSTLSVI